MLALSFLRARRETATRRINAIARSFIAETTSRVWGMAQTGAHLFGPARVPNGSQAITLNSEADMKSQIKRVLSNIQWFALLASMSCSASGWYECSMAGVSPNLTAKPPVVFSNWNTPSEQPPRMAAGTWHTIDVSDQVPLGARCIHITGMMVITYGTTAGQSCGLYVSFRRDSEAGRQSNTAYTIETQKGGVRIPYSITVPLKHVGTQLLFDFSANIQNYLVGQTPGYYGLMWPTGCSVGVVGYINWYGF